MQDDQKCCRFPPHGIAIYKRAQRSKVKGQRREAASKASNASKARKASNANKVKAEVKVEEGQGVQNGIASLRPQ